MLRVAVYSKKYNTAFVYITNNFELTAIDIAAIYQNRWQIEVFFKKLKQNFRLPTSMETIPMQLKYKYGVLW